MRPDAQVLSWLLLQQIAKGKDKDIRQALIETGDVDVMISVGTNFFYTKSLPCSLWFFDKAKREESRDKSSSLMPAITTQ